MPLFPEVLDPARAAATVMSPVHCLFGLHIVRRGLLFIDLAVAQVAALGMAFALAKGFSADNPADETKIYLYSLAFALAGSLLISVTRFRLGKVPHEAVIGIVYVVASAGAFVLLEFSPHGAEELKSLFQGNILFVQPSHVWSVAYWYGAVMVVLLLFWKPITKVSLQTEDAPAGIKLVLLDVLYYSLLGFVVASSVKIAGVLVVFSWLVMPAVVAFLFVEKMSAAVIIALPVSLIGSWLGLLLSFYAPAIALSEEGRQAMAVAGAEVERGWPSGPSIVLALGAIVTAAYLIRLLLPDKKPRPER